ADMAENRYFNHEEKEHPNKRFAIDRLRTLGLRPMVVAENIATQFGIKYIPGRPAYPLDHGGLSDKPDGKPIPPHTYASFAKVVVDAWMASPPHREDIMLRDAKYMGAAARELWPGKGTRQGEEDFHKFFIVQVFFTPLPPRGDN